jgi:hypothetical protein
MSVSSIADKSDQKKTQVQSLVYLYHQALWQTLSIYLCYSCTLTEPNSWPAMVPLRL